MTIFRPPKHHLYTLWCACVYGSDCRSIILCCRHVSMCIYGRTALGTSAKTTKISFVSLETGSLSGCSSTRSLGCFVKEHYRLVYVSLFRAGLQAQTNIPFHVTWVWESNTNLYVYKSRIVTGPSPWLLTFIFFNGSQWINLKSIAKTEFI